MQIKPEIAIHERINDEKIQKELSYNPYGSGSRSNNRKNTKGRKTQYIQMIDDSVWPPRLFQKTIKHKSN